MNIITQEDKQKIQKLLGNIDTFSSQNVGGTVGAADGFTAALFTLRKTAKIIGQQTQSDELTKESILNLEADLKNVAAMSGGGSLSKDPHISPEEISGVITFLDKLADKLDS